MWMKEHDGNKADHKGKVTNRLLPVWSQRRCHRSEKCVHDVHRRADALMSTGHKVELHLHSDHPNDTPDQEVEKEEENERKTIPSQSNKDADESPFRSEEEDRSPCPIQQMKDIHCQFQGYLTFAETAGLREDHEDLQ